MNIFSIRSSKLPSLSSQRYSSKAENFIGETTQSGRQKISFWMMVNAATLPVGGFVNTIGFYAVPELFERNSKVLYAITASMSPNQQEIMGRLNENLRRLGQASKTMAETTVQHSRNQMKRCLTQRSRRQQRVKFLPNRRDADWRERLMPSANFSGLKSFCALGAENFSSNRYLPIGGKGCFSLGSLWTRAKRA